MNELNRVEKFLMTYSGEHYKKPEGENDKMSVIKSMGHDARNAFVEFGNIINDKLPEYKVYKCSNWLSMNQIIPDYLWIQFKKIGYEHLPSSISLAAKKVYDKFYLAQHQNVFLTALSCQGTFITF